MKLTPEQAIKQQYIALAKLLKAYANKPTHSELLNLTLSFCKNLHQLAQAKPDLVFAQPQLYKAQLPYQVNLSFNACVNTCLLAIRNKVDPAVSIQLMCSSLSLYTSAEQQTQAFFQDSASSFFVAKPNPALLKLLSLNQQHIWLTSYRQSCGINLAGAKNSNRLTVEGAICYFAHQLALLCTPRKSGARQTFSAALKRLTVQAPEKFYALLSPLISYPGLIPPGSYLKTQQGELLQVLAIHATGLVSLASKSKTPSEQSDNAIRIIKPKVVSKHYPSQVLKSFSRLNTVWGDNFTNWQNHHKTNDCIAATEPMLPLGKAPASLLVVQDQLKQSNVDIHLMVKAISKEPEYTQQLLTAASNSNRQKQSVHNLQQALAMLGYERTASVFLQHSLIARLNQHYFPLQLNLLNFTQLMVFIAKTLAHQQLPEAENTISSIVYFLLSRLFTLPRFRVQTKWHSAVKNSYLIEGLLTDCKQDVLKQGAIRLAQAWQQPSQTIQVIQNYHQVEKSDESNPQIQSLATLVTASFIMANQIYFAQYQPDQKFTKLMSNLLTQLSFSKQQWTDLKQQISADSGVFCPLV